MSDESLSAVESLYFRWRAFRTAGRPVPAAALCRDQPHLRAALEERIAAEHPDDTPDGTGDYTPQGPAFEVVDVDADGTGAYTPADAPAPAVAAADSQGWLLSLLDAWQNGRDAGREPTPEELCPHDPGRRAVLAQHIAAARALDPDAPSEAPDDGPDPDAPSPPAAEPYAVGRFTVVAEHARGGMGRVSSAVDTELSRRVAFKDIQGRFADDPVARHRFTREALITGQLEHPGVIPVYGLGTDRRGRPFYAMRFVEGQSLKDAVKAFHADPPKRSPSGAKGVAFRGLLKRFADVCNAVAFAHSKQIVHRDLKPANVMLGPFGETLVVDWGLARSYADRRPDAPTTANASGSEETADLAPEKSRDTVGTRTGAVMGTPAYMSPEQASGDLPTLGPAWDIYSLGATLYELLTGRPPFTGKPMGELMRDIRAGVFAPPRAVAAWVPAPLDAVCRRAMSRLPEERYDTALELAAEVERWLADEPVTAYRETRAERARRWAKRHPVLVRTVAALFLLGTPALALGLGVVYFQKREITEAERLKDDAYKREKASHDNERAARARSEAALEQARTTLDLTTDELVGKVLAKQSKLGPDERAFLERLVTSYATFAAADGADPRERLVAARAKLRVAQLWERLGNGDAPRGYREAVAALRPLAGSASDPELAQVARRDLAAALTGFGRTAPLFTPEIAPWLREAVRLREEAHTAHPDDADRFREVGEVLRDVARVMDAHGYRDQTIERYRQYIAKFGRLTIQNRLGPAAFEQLGEVYDELARALLRAGKAEEAYRELDAAKALFEALERTFPKEPRFRFLRVRARVAQVPILMQDGKAEEAEEVIRPLVEAYRDLVREYPAVREYREGQATAQVSQAEVLLKRGKPAEAVKALDVARGALSRLAGDYPEFPKYRSQLILALRDQARLNVNLLRFADAARANDEADALEGKPQKK